MQHHLRELGEKVRATAEFTDFESLEIYGKLNDALRQWLPHVTEGITFTHHPTHWGGFMRLHGATSERRVAAARHRAPTILLAWTVA